MADITQRLLWTLLPNGADGAKLRFSVLVSPRLTLSSAIPAHDLSHFADWQDWPGVIGAAKFTIQVDGGAGVDAVATSVADTAVWQALFPTTTFVRPYAFTDLRSTTVLSYPVAALSKTIQGLYGQLAVNATDALPTTGALQSFMPLGRRLPEPADVLKALRDGGFDSYAASPVGQVALLQAYHRPLNAEITAQYVKTGPADPRENASWRTHATAALPRPEDFSKLIDFHQVVGSLVQYPQLARLSGLIVDLEIPRDGLTDGDHSIQLEVSWPKADPAVQTDADVLPVSQTHLHGKAFHMRARDAATPISTRFLRLQKSPFDLVEVDVDGAGIKVKNFAISLPRIRNTAFDDETFGDKPPATAGAPSLRSAGLMLSQAKRGQALKALFDGSGGLQDKLQADEPLAPLFAEDTVRGYRVDVLEESGKWRSLMRRDGEYVFVNTGDIRHTTDEEGMVRLAGGSSTDGSNPDILKIHEGVFVWKGWSLAAPEPGRVVMPNDSVGEPDDAAPAGLPLETRFTPTRQTLPSLRFGRTYSMRVRLVDLTGEAEPFQEADIQPADAISQPVLYRRYEPLETPTLALVMTDAGVEGPADGESMARAAIRSLNDSPEKNAVATADRARRHLIPARTSHRFAETHGVMDTAAGRIDPGLFGMLSTLDHALAETTVVTPGPTVGSADVTTSYAVAPESFELPYLPDPWCIGAALRVVGATGVNPDTIHLVPFYGDLFDPDARPDWPKARPFTIVAAESGAPDAAFDPASREFRVPLAKAERARVRISALMPRWAVPNMAIHQLLLDQKPDQITLQRLEDLIAHGQHWMLTPWRTIELVHAVQKPLITPNILQISVQRDLGSAAATPTFRMPLHAKSTVRIDLEGGWSEPLDDLEASAPVDQSHTQHAFDVKIARNEAPQNIYSVSGHAHVFADTRYRRVTYRVDCTTRFREYMPAAIRTDKSELTVSSNEVRAWIPNSAPPPAPSVLYVVPTFGWTRSAGPGGSTSWRTGGGLRVYLDRPWFASGYGEMLGVVLPPVGASLSDVDGVLKPYITQWGADPIWNSARVTAASPPKSAFPLAKWRAPIPFDGTTLPAIEGSDLPPGDFSVAGLAHPELPATSPVKLDVAPHPVGYDAERKLWYADIVIRPGEAYYPFVRLALARYQPTSVWGAHLSSVVLAEFQQLTADRLTVVTHAATDVRAHIAVYGIVPQDSRGGEPRSGVFEVETQVLDPGADPDLGWRKLEAPDPLSGGGTLATEGPAQPVAVSAPAPAQLRDRPPIAGAAAPLAEDARSALLLEAQHLLGVQDFSGLLARSDLIAVIRPPEIWQADVVVPAKPEGGRRRLLITESETYITGEPVGNRPAPLGRRVVYAEAVEL